MKNIEGISVQLPLQYSQLDGPYTLNKTLKDVIKQNYKMLVLTSPGERPMVPDFGIGFNNFVFEQMSNDTLDNITEKIIEQTKMFMPVVNLENIQFITDDEDSSFGRNRVQVIITYNILPFNERDELRIGSDD
jgi:phage baseplate assembly protein W